MTEKSLDDEVPAKGTRAARLEARVTNEQKTLWTSPGFVDTC
jgi:hypothetical protein